MTRQRRSAVAGVVAATAVVILGALTVHPDAGASPRVRVVPLDVSGSFDADGHTVTYNLSGVEVDPATDVEYHHSGTVVSDTVTLSGSASFTIGEGLVTNLGMSASLSAAGGESVSESWPPEGVDGRVGDTTVDFPFSLTVTIPPPSTTTTSPFGPDPFATTTTTPGATTTTTPPYSTVAFSVSSQNCNDVGVCGGPVIDGTFGVFAPPSAPGDSTAGWLATVGALGAVAAAAAALAGSRGGGSGDRYVLQVSSDELSISPSRPAALEVQVWRVGPSGATMPAPGASAQLTAGADIEVVPPVGATPLTATVATTAAATGGGESTIEVTAEAGGGSMQATVRVLRSGSYELELY